MKFSSHNLLQKTSSLKTFSKEIVICFVMIFVPFFPPRTAEAGFLSFFSEIGVDEVSANVFEVNASNSQNMALLKAAVNSDPNPNKSPEPEFQVSGNALVAQIGPLGTATEIKEDPSSTQISVYIVRSGDSLLQIAKIFNVSVNTIIWANNLGKNPILKEGQTLVILPISGIRYTVLKGDTIKGIVSRHKADLEDVLRYNSISLDSTLHPGDVIIIPAAEPFLPSSPTTGGKKYVSGTNPLHDADGPSYPKYYIRPVKGGIKTQELHGYNAVDIAAAHGTPIYAAASGTVIASVSGGWNGGYGSYVIIIHPNGTQTLYSHNSKNLVTQGQRVEQGEMIAKMGATGQATGSHVHFEIRGAKNPF